MKRNHRIETQLGDLGSHWAEALQREVVADLSTERVHDISVVAAGLAAGSALTIPAAAGAVAATTQGGTVMTTSIAATATSHAIAKIVGAGALAAALTVGGTAAVTGNLPDGAQRAVADAAAHVGLTLPRPDTEAEASVRTGAKATSDVVAVGSAGRLVVSLDGDAGLSLDEVQAEAGFRADVLVETPDLLIVEFASAEEILAVEVTAVNGRIRSLVSIEAGAGAEGSKSGGDGDESPVAGEAETEVATRGNGAVQGKTSGEGQELDGEATAEAEAEAEVGIGIGLSLGG